MQFVAVSNKRVNSIWTKRKNQVRALRNSTDKNIPLPKFPDVVNEYLNKGVKYDHLYPEYIELLEKFIALENSISQK